MTPSGFENLGINERLLSAIAAQRFTTPTPIQSRVIPIATKGSDVVGIAQTGTGKTLAFGVPLMQKILAQPMSQALIMCPTRELAMQVEEMIQKVGRTVGLKTVVLIGGTPIRPQMRELSRQPHIVIATPGRLMDHLNQKNLTLKNVSCVVLDEADRMLDIGFMPQIKQILAQAPKERQTMLFSATMPPAIAEIANRFMKNPVKIEVAPQGTTAENVDQEMFIVHRDDKVRLLDKILAETTGSVLVFSRTKHGAKKLSRNVQFMGQTAIEMHSNRSFSQRKQALEGFKSGKYRVLVATDVAARGIDVNNIALVINFDLPDDLGDYVHRIGRTGRAGKSGKAISFVTPDQKMEIRQIERLIRKPVTVSPLPILPARREPPAPVFYQRANTGFTRAPARRNNFSMNRGNDRMPERKTNFVFGRRNEPSAEPRTKRVLSPKFKRFSRKSAPLPKKFFNRTQSFA